MNKRRTIYISCMLGFAVIWLGLAVQAYGRNPITAGFYVLAAIGFGLIGIAQAKRRS